MVTQNENQMIEKNTHKKEVALSNVLETTMERLHKNHALSAFCKNTAGQHVESKKHWIRLARTQSMRIRLPTSTAYLRQ